MTIGENIKRLRKARGLTQTELSHIVGIHNRLLQRYESGNRIPKQDRIDEIAIALGVNPQALCPPNNVPGSKMHALFQLFNNNDVKFDKHGNLTFKDSFAAEISLWYKQWKTYQEAIEKADLIEDETERAYAIENATDRFNYWMDTYPHSAAINVDFEKEFERFHKIKERKRKQKK